METIYYLRVFGTRWGEISTIPERCPKKYHILYTKTVISFKAR